MYVCSVDFIFTITVEFLEDVREVRIRASKRIACYHNYLMGEVRFYTSYANCTEKQADGVSAMGVIRNEAKKSPAVSISPIYYNQCYSKSQSALRPVSVQFTRDSFPSKMLSISCLFDVHHFTALYSTDFDGSAGNFFWQNVISRFKPYNKRNKID